MGTYNKQGSVATEQPPAVTATLSAVASSATSAAALAVNLDRRGLLAQNTDANDCYLKYGATAATNSFTVIIPTNGYLEMPQPIYQGRIDVIWSVDGAGSLYLTAL